MLFLFHGKVTSAVPEPQCEAVALLLPGPLESICGSTFASLPSVWDGSLLPSAVTQSPLQRPISRARSAALIHHDPLLNNNKPSVSSRTKKEPKSWWRYEHSLANTSGPADSSCILFPQHLANL